MGKKRPLSDVAVDLVQLANASPQVRRVRAEHIPKDCMQLLCVCCQAILKGSVPLSKSQKERLQPYKQDLRKIASKKIHTKTKRDILKKGGVLKNLMK